MTEAATKKNTQTGFIRKRGKTAVIDVSLIAGAMGLNNGDQVAVTIRKVVPTRMRYDDEVGGEVDMEQFISEKEVAEVAKKPSKSAMSDADIIKDILKKSDGLLIDDIQAQYASITGRPVDGSIEPVVEKMMSKGIVYKRQNGTYNLA